jgi:hypothetical protein
MDMQDSCFAIMEVMSLFWRCNDSSGYGYVLDEDGKMLVNVENFYLVGDDKDHDMFYKLADFFRPKKPEHSDQVVFAVFREYTDCASVDEGDVRFMWSDEVPAYKNYALKDVAASWIESIGDKIKINPIDTIGLIEEAFRLSTVSNALSDVSTSDDKDEYEEIPFIEVATKAAKEILNASEPEVKK